MTELEERKRELEELAAAEMKARQDAFLEAYDALKAEYKMQLVPYRIESPGGVQWKLIAESNEK
jgi:hypothetical protein